jgi:hypothetical protein
VAQRCEEELGEERVVFGDGDPRDGSQLPRPEGPLTVGLDGGYVRDWDQKQRHFEVIVGKFVLPEQPAKCFGFVQSYDTKAKRRLGAVLQSQGVQESTR